MEEKAQALQGAPRDDQAGPVADPFNPESLRLSQDFEAMAPVTKVIATMPVRKPNRQEFFRTHPTLRIDTLIIELKAEQEFYLVSPSLREQLAEETVPMRLHFAINRADALFVFPARLPGTDGRDNRWWESLRSAGEQAITEWIRVTSNNELGAYQIRAAPAGLSEPDWPDLDLRDLLRIAFRSNYLDSADHLVLRRLRGEV